MVKDTEISTVARDLGGLSCPPNYWPGVEAGFSIPLGTRVEVPATHALAKAKFIDQILPPDLISLIKDAVSLDFSIDIHINIREISLPDGRTRKVVEINDPVAAFMLSQFYQSHDREICLFPDPDGSLTVTVDGRPLAGESEHLVGSLQFLPSA